MKNAYDLPLEAMNNDLNFTAKCATGRDDTVSGNRRQRVMGGLNAIVGPKPLYFEENPEWRAKRHQEVVDMVRMDEVVYGRLGQ